MDRQNTYPVENIAQLKDRFAEFIENGSFEAAFTIFMEIRTYLQEHLEVQNDQKVLDEYKDIQSRAGWMVIDRLQPKDALSAMRAHPEYFFEEEWTFRRDQVKTVAAKMTTFADRDAFKAEIRKIIEEGNAQIGSEVILLNGQEVPPTMAFWIQDYRNSTTQDDIGDSLSITQYINTNPNVAKLSLEDKQHLEGLIRFYTRLFVKSETAEGMDDVVTYSDVYTGTVHMIMDGKDVDTKIESPVIASMTEEEKQLTKERIAQNLQYLSELDMERLKEGDYSQFEEYRRKEQELYNLEPDGTPRTGTPNTEAPTRSEVLRQVLEASQAPQKKPVPVPRPKAQLPLKKHIVAEPVPEPSASVVTPLRLVPEPLPEQPATPVVAAPAVEPQPKPVTPAATPPKTPAQPVAVARRMARMKPRAAATAAIQPPVSQPTTMPAPTAAPAPMPAPAPTPAPTPRRSPKPRTGIDFTTLSQQVLADHALLLDSVDTEKRFLSLISAYAKGEREAAEVMQTLVTPSEQGGINITAGMAAQVMRTADELVQYPERIRKRKMLATEQAKTTPRPTLSMVQDAMERQRELEEKTAAPTTDKPVEAAPQPGLVEDMFANLDVSVNGNQPSDKPESPLRQIGVPRGLVGVTGGSMPARSVRPQGSTTPTQPLTVRRSAPGASRAASTPVMGPLDELRAFSIDEFRAYGDARAATAAIEEKVQLLGQQSVARRAEGIRAWQQSPVHQMYVAIGNTSLQTGVPVHQYIEGQQQMGGPTLSIQEFDAISALNRSLRF